MPRRCFIFGRDCTPPTWLKDRLGPIVALSIALCITNVDSVNAISCSVQAPVSAPIIEMFREPPCPWCAGKRGVVYATIPGTAANAGASGVVSFAGPVGGVNYVVVRTVDGVLVTHGDLATAYLHTGDLVVAGEPVGQVNARLYFGVRIDGRYIDPLRCMAGGTITARRAILVPAPIRHPASGTP